MTVSPGKAGFVVVVYVSHFADGSSRRSRDAPPAKVPAHNQRVPPASMINSRDEMLVLKSPDSFPMTVQRPESKRTIPSEVPTQIVLVPSGRLVSRTCVTISLGS